MSIAEQLADEFLEEARNSVISQRIVVDIYCRVSTDDQEDNTSLDEQEELSLVIFVSTELWFSFALGYGKDSLPGSKY